jgi:Trypsin-co-occurring domain 1
LYDPVSPNGMSIAMEVTPIASGASPGAAGPGAPETRTSSLTESPASSAIEHKLRDLTDSIESISTEIYSALKAVRPTRAKVRFGIEVGAEGGQLTALIVKGSGKASLRITLEWESGTGSHQ